MDLALRFEKNSGIIYREEEDGAFLFDPQIGNLKYMNRSAKEAFLMLNGQNDVSVVIHHLLGLYSEGDPKLIEKDVGSFLRDLEENGFICPKNAK